MSRQKRQPAAGRPQKEATMTVQVVHLRAEAKWGCSGQYIARLVGRAPKYTFGRVFVGSKYGKRGESTAYDTDESGLFEICNVGKRGKEKEFWLVLPYGNGLTLLRSDLDDAMAIAKRLDKHEKLEEIIAIELGDELKNYDGTPKLKDDGTPRHELVYTIRTPAKAAAAV